MSGDGRYVAFTSNATDLVPGVTINNGFQNVFVTDLQTGTTTLVDINAAGTAAANVGGDKPSISSDGRYLAFESFSSDLIPGGTTKFPNVYVRDLQAHTTTLVSVNAAGTGDAGGSAPIISGNGQFVAFQSNAADLVPGFVDHNGNFSDFYVRNLQTGVTILATADASGVGGQNTLGGTYVLSADGSVLAFVTGASNLFAGDRNGSTTGPNPTGTPDVYAATTTPGQGTISGQVFDDVNGNGSKDPGDSGLAGWTVYLDLNGDGKDDNGEPSVVTDSSGNYTFHGLSAGTYIVAVVPQANEQETHPAAPGSYTVNLATDTSTASGEDFGEHQVFADLFAQSVTVTPASVAAGQSVNVSWSVKNQGQADASGTWADAVFLSSQTTLGPSSTLLALVDHSGLAIGSSYTGQASVAIPGLSPGSYRIIVQVDYRNQVPEGPSKGNNVAASGPLSVTIPTLTLGTPLADAFTGADQARYYQVTATPGHSLQLALQSAAGSGSVGLYISRDALPTPYVYDFRPDDLFQPSQLVTVPVAQPGTYYILAESLSGDAATASFTITASQPGFAIRRIGVAQGGQGGQVTIPIVGSDLTPGVQVSLVAGGQTIAASSVDFRDATSLYATFDLTGAGLGAYDVRVGDGTHTATLPGAFQVVALQSNPLQVTMVTQPYLRDNRPSPLVITYTNTGNVDLVAPILQVTADKADLSLAGDPQLAGHTAQVLAIGSDGPAGVLRPGESGQITMEAQGTSQIRHDQVTFQLGVADTTDPTPIDWASLKDQLRPSYIQQDAWDVIWGNLTAELGTTNAQYLAVLSADASALSEIGQATADPSQLLAFQIAQANDLMGGASLDQAGDIGLPTPGIPLVFGRTYLQPISGRYRRGPMGRGWADNWEISATTDTDGNVTIQQGGIVTAFTKQADGSYAGTFGNPSRLTQSGGVYQLTDALNNVYTFRADGSFGSVADPNGNTITAGYTGSQLTSLTHSNGSWLHLSYDVQGRLIGIAASDGRSVTYTYDATDQHLISATTPSGTTTYAYVTGQGPAREHALSLITRPGGVQESFSYDALGRLIANDYGTAARFTLVYPNPGELDVSNNGGPASRVFYDQDAQPRMIRDPLGQTYQFTFDASGNLIGALTPQGTTYSYSYDAHNNPTGQVDPLGQGVSVSYNQQTNEAVTVTDPMGHTTTFGYDAKGNLTSITYPDNSTEQYQYDAQGDLITSTNRRGQALHYTYNAQGLVTREDFADGTHVDFGYDAQGNLTSVTDASGTTTAQYDANGRLTELTEPSGQFLQYTYDNAGRRIKTVDQTGFTVNYQYDANGRLIGLTDASNAPIVTYTYNAQGWLAEAQNGNGTYTTYDYDADGNVLHLVNYAPNSTVNSRFDSTYDALGRRISLTTLDGTTNYTYDATGQLVGVTLPGGETITYTYDADGNRISATDNGATTSYTSNALNQYTAAGSTQYTYDADGNLITETNASGTTTYTYDQRNRLTAVQGPQGTWSYQYDALGNLTAITHNGVTTRELTDPLEFNMLVAEYDGTGQLIAHYTYGDGLVSRVAAGGTNYYDFDPTGSTVGLSGASGSYVNKYSYLPFGQTTTLASAVSNPFTFAGQFGVNGDGSGLFHMQFRRYDPTTGQFTSEDPLGFSGGDVNLRRYVLNDPTGLTDPAGLAWLAIVPFPIFGCCYIYDVSEAGPLSQANLETGHEQFFFTDGQGVTVPGTNNVVDNIGWGPTHPGTTNNDPVGEFATGENQANGYINRYWLDDELLRQAIADVGRPANGWQLTGYNCQSYAQDVVNAYSKRYWQQPPPVRTRILIQSFAHVLFGGDPNEMVGPTGYGPANFRAPGGDLPYTIDFTNDPNVATAPAQDVTITETLDPHLDWTTFELGPIGFGPMTVDVPAGLQSYQTQVMYHNQDGSPLRVDITAALDLSTGVATWTFRSVDPSTGTFPTNPFAGFLPVDDATKVGEAYVSYFIKERPSPATGTAIDAAATVVFDTNAPITTNTYVNTIDADPPTSSVDPLPATTTNPSFTVSWSGSDGLGSGIASYDILVSDDGGPFQPFLTSTTATSAVFTGQVGHTYRFSSVATDNVGLVQATPGVAPGAITVVAPTPTPTPSPLPALVTVINVQLVLDKKHRVTQILVDFSGALDPAEADNLGAYRLATAGKGGSFVAKNAKVIRLKSAEYDGAHLVVRLTPRRPFAIKKPVQLRLSGLPPSGLRDLSGRLIDGNRDGQQGGDATVLLSARGATLSAIASTPAAARPIPSVAALDALLDTGEWLPSHRRPGL
jgi:RHS repeat-associated protein